MPPARVSRFHLKSQTLMPASLNAKQKHLGCKKVQGQEEPVTKSSDIK